MRVIYLITGTSFVVGIVAAWIGARAFTAPLARLRHALGRVAAGHLVDVPVDEAGEIGELQAGFNEMVSELRQRDRVRDLFGRHVGGDVAAIAAEADRGTRAERREVSTVFVDVIGSSGMTLMKTPDEVVAVLNAFFDVVVRAIDAEGGVINKFEGDGVLGVFGAPAAQPDHAERALRAARNVRERIEELAETMWIDAAIGVASGRAIAGNVGAAERYEYTIIGRPVDHAVRLCDEAKRLPSRVLACRSTLQNANTEAAYWTRRRADRDGRRRRTRARRTTEPMQLTREPTIEMSQPTPTGTGAALGRKLRWRILRSLVIANAFGSTIVAAGAIAFHRIYPGGIEPSGFVSSVLIGYAVFVVGCAIGLAEVRRRFAVVERWLAEERLPSAGEVVALVRQPRRQASFPMPYWIVAYVAVVAYQLFRLGLRSRDFSATRRCSPPSSRAPSPRGHSRTCSSNARCGPRSARRRGPLCGHVPTTMKTFPRLLFAWMVSSALPMVTLTFALVGLDASPARSLRARRLCGGALLGDRRHRRHGLRGPRRRRSAERDPRARCGRSRAAS